MNNNSSLSRTLASVNPEFYDKIRLAWVIVTTLMIIVGLFFWNSEIKGFEPGKISVIIFSAWAILSFRGFENTEYGVISFAGKPRKVVIGGGLELIPRGIFLIDRTAAGIYETELPGEPEEVQKTSDDEPLRKVEIKVGDKVVSKTSVRPIRVVTAGPAGDDQHSNDPLDARLTIEPSFWVRWRVTNPVLFELQLHNPEEAVRQLRDVGETILTKMITERTPKQLNAQFGSLTENLRDTLRIHTEEKEWGIEIVEAGLNPFDFKKTVAEAMQTIATAKAKADAAIAEARETVTKADAEAYRLERVGHGEAAAIAVKGKAEGKAAEELLAGRGRGTKRAAEFIGVTPAQVLAAEVTEKTVGEGTIIIGEDGIAKAVAVGAALIKKGTDE